MRSFSPPSDAPTISESSTTHTCEDGYKRNPFLVEKLSIPCGVLQVTHGPHQGCQLPLDKTHYHVGREEWCDIALPHDLCVSKHHCELRFTHEGLQVRDLQSRNGIYIDQIRVFEALFPPGAKLQVGESILQLQLENAQTQIDAPFHDNSFQLVGKSASMRHIFSLLSRLAPCDLPVLLLGETGTGKTSVAQALHTQSPRHDKPFVVVNCGAIPPNLMESEFFGHEKGAFTGAATSHRGYLEQAHGGTLFLDEIGELPLELQPKLLDALERKQIKRLGSEADRRVDFRLISATHRSMAEQLAGGQFREDLYYRIAVAEITVPPLRDRPEDIPLLVELFLQKLNPARPVHFSPDAIKALKEYLWPGNIRQLRNILECALAFTTSTLLHAEDLDLPSAQDHLAPPLPPTSPLATSSPSPSQAPLKQIMAHAERAALERVLQETGWNITQTAERLQISRVWVYNRIKKYNLQDPTKSG